MRSATRTAVSIVAAAALPLSFAAALAPSASAHPADSRSSHQSPRVHPTQRLCATPKRPGIMACFAVRRTDSLNQKANPALPSGYGPVDLQSAYGLGGGNAAGRVVAIIDAYDDPTAESDLATYRSTYGLPPCTTANGCFRKVNQNGQQSNYPAANAGWAGEISLDLDMVSAACPSCGILLVEANSASIANLGTAVNRAVTMGAKYVSNSYGGSESSSETSWDTSYYRHNGVAVTASTGDNGYGVSYPASSPYVTAVGGTSLTRGGGSRGWTESAWSGAGSGCSAYEAKPSYQNVNTGCSKRAVADVSAVADPNTGVAVYQTYGGSGWAVYGGTSASAPIIASVYALAGVPGSGDNPASYPYSHAGNLWDVTTGSNGSCSVNQWCHAVVGWDGPTGLGTPNGTAAFKSGGQSGQVVVTNPGNQTTTVGTPVNLQMNASGGTPPYTWSATGLPAGLSINTSSGLISGTPTTTGVYNVSVTAKDSLNATGNAAFTWTIQSGGGGCSGQLLGNPGFETGSAPPWAASSGVISSNGSGQTSHSGSWFAWLDGYGTTHTDTLSQSVTIPAGCHASYTFWLHIDTAETTTTQQYDKLTVKVGSTLLATYSNLNKASGYSQKSFDLSAYAGQTVSLNFTGTEDGSLQTSFVVDDTSVALS